MSTEPSYIEVDDAEDAVRLRFLGSPVRMNGHDIEPGAAERTDFVFACRIYRTVSGIPLAGVEVADVCLTATIGSPTSQLPCGRGSIGGARAVDYDAAQTAR